MAEACFDPMSMTYTTPGEGRRENSEVCHTQRVPQTLPERMYGGWYKYVVPRGAYNSSTGGGGI